MTLGGWITFLMSVSSFTLLFVWCLYKVISTKRKEDDDISSAFEMYSDDEGNQKK